MKKHPDTQLYSASEIAAMCKPPSSTSTVHRWAKLGVLVDGKRIKLARHRVGGTFAFLKKDLEEFVGRLNG